MAARIYRPMFRYIINDSEAGIGTRNNWIRNICRVKREDKSDDRSKMNALREQTGMKPRKEESSRKQNEMGQTRGKN